jgi:HAE1 family hydrophobic/amphiphilic exporter-1
MFSRFFIDRPIFANVIALVTVLFGLVTLVRLPVEQYPQITPPTVNVTTTYPGANAQVVADTVAAPIEQQVNGVEGMLYMSSTCSSDGSYALTVTFDVGTNIDMAQVLVQNRVQIAQASLPEEVKRQGVVTKKQSTNILLFATLSAPGGQFDSLYLCNYATIHVRDELSRIAGVGDIQVIGSGDYSMRLWLDPDKLKARNLTTQDVLDAVGEQNVQVAAGQIGQPPAPADQGFQYTVTTLGRLTNPEQFANIIVKTASGSESNPSSRITRVKDVARVELGAQVYDQFFEVDGKPSAGIGVYLLPGANALDVATRVRQKMDELKRSFPEGVEYDVPFDTTKFVKASIHEVYWALAEAGVLVLIVILVFLQDWRALLVPATTVPVTIIGAFAAMAALGFSVNMLTLFGLVLAIGIVVDDAIIIVENASHHIGEGMTPRDATVQAMAELVGPILGITLVLLAVFLPTAFLGGITGQLYRQFALTIAATALISALNALTLKPAQCASYLRAPSGKRKFFFRWFDAVYGVGERAYAAVVARVVRHPVLAMALFAALAAVTAWGFLSLPTGFLPTEDQGYFVISIQLPDAAAQERTREVGNRVTEVLQRTPGIDHVITVGGQNVFEGTVTSNAAAMYVTLKSWEERTDPGQSQEGILKRLGGEFAQIPAAVIVAFPPPAIMGLGVAGGFQMRLQDRGGVGLVELGQVARDVVQAGNAQSNLSGVSTTFSPGVPQLYVDIDRTKAKSLNVPLTNVFSTLQTYLGSAYANDFNKFGRTYQVRLQAEARFRATPDAIRRLEVRNRSGDMVPLGTLARVERKLGPQSITRYNLYPSAAVMGQAAPGTSSGEALTLMEQVARDKLPPAIGYEWTDMSFQEQRVGSQALWIFGLAVLLVYFVLAAQYESWTSPAAVILVVPLALLGTVAAVALRGLDNNVYTQIGIVLIIALASKNAILIVEFARELRAGGKGIAEAAAEAARLRLRPILMTSFAFILGVYPLVIATGAGAASRRALGTAVFGGMIASTLLAVFFVPAFYVVCQGVGEWWARSNLLRVPAVRPSAWLDAARTRLWPADGPKTPQEP